jgi:hypothetical protein
MSKSAIKTMATCALTPQQSFKAIDLNDRKSLKVVLYSILTTGGFLA